MRGMPSEHQSIAYRLAIAEPNFPCSCDPTTVESERQEGKSLQISEPAYNSTKTHPHHPRNFANPWSSPIISYILLLSRHPFQGREPLD